MACVLLMIQLFAWLNIKDKVKKNGLKELKDLTTREDENGIAIQKCQIKNLI